eukprot:CAMPEP_0183578816 /NCGR_PEP_ID=MMETSP0371-20130417/142517_1 /TAXON_ID=268820 /ORGANISM="Peridinium aciculiferum, Strain PAER-2" /LENGTH=69 /DNA_ID=CAMNT_0025789271 /DNA_START=262 /DNA_END=472 /DNA_ORIENTATION=-
MDSKWANLASRMATDTAGKAAARSAPPSALPGTATEARARAALASASRRPEIHSKAMTPVALTPEPRSR